MAVTLESLGLLPRKPLVIEVVERETVRSIIHAERALIGRAHELGLNIDQVHLGWAPYVEQLRSQLTPLDKSEFDRLFVEESLNDEALDQSQQAEAAARREAELHARTKMPDATRIFFAGVNITILIGLGIYWASR